MTLGWIDRGNGRQTLRSVREPRVSRRADLPSPRLIRDAFDAPVQSMADGQWYESKRALAATHKASGNPLGQDFIELGHEDVPWREHQSSEAELRDDIQSAIADVEAGRLPDVLTLTD